MKNAIKICYNNLRFSMGLILSASRKYFILNMLFSIVSALVPYIPMILWKELLNRLIEYPAKMDSRGILTVIICLAAAYSVTLIIEKLLDLFSSFINYKYTDEVGYYLDNYIVDKVSSVELAFYDSSTLNNTLKTVTSHLRGSTEDMVNFVFSFINGVVQLAVAVVMISTLSPWMIPVVIVLIIPSVLQSKHRQKEEYEFEKKHSLDERKSEYYRDLFFDNSRQEIKLYNAADYFIECYEKSWTELKRAKLMLKIKNNVTWILQYACLTAVELIAYIAALFKLTAGAIGVGDVTYYISVANQVRDNFVGVFYLMVSFFQRSQEVSDIKEFMEMKPVLETSGTKIPSDNPRIEFRNVSFRYPGADSDVLKDCSFVIEPGEMVGLVGLNGAGKSTIVKLLCRFYDPYEGRILIDGVDAREYDIVKLRGLFGILFQDFVRYSMSLRENVALSDISRIGNDSEIKLACEKSKSAEFSESWEKGIDTSLTRQFDSEGAELSGGQWQRIALARAFFRDAPVILLDEPSAALDPVAEHGIFEDFAKLSENKSAVLISHRLSSITLCDRILVLSDGRIIEQGSHAALMEQDGEYARLFNLQASKYM